MKMGVQIAHFPLQRSLEDFDFSLQPSIDRTLIRELETGRYLANGDNVLLLGPPGVGKTHLAIGLGRRAIAVVRRASSSLPQASTPSCWAPRAKVAWRNGSATSPSPSCSSSTNSATSPSSARRPTSSSSWSTGATRRAA